MKLYLLTQHVRNDYDTYDSCVVAAETEEEAVQIHPSEYGSWGEKYGSWAETPEQVICTCIGTANPETKKGVIISSFNAG